MPLLASHRWAEVDALFDETLDRPADERTAFLRARCGGDAELYHAVTDLLALDAAAEEALGEHATDFAEDLLEEVSRAEEQREAGLPDGTRLGPYRVEREIGRGGMGTVYRAARADGAFDKTVAVKLVKRGMDTDEVLRRFRYERQILAGLDHPGIARLLDAGEAADGRPFLVMELAEGEPLTAYADRVGLSIEVRLQLFEEVCEAVAYAHRRLVVHRDLKPSNVLAVEDEHGTPRVKLLDFGIARLLDTEAGAEPDAPRTRPEARILTPEYAAPEQLRGEPVTTATDVYALGVILYELLVGQRPDRPAASPSSVVSGEESPATRATARNTTPDALRRTLRGDLDTLVLKALHPDAERRYASAEALAEDLRRRRTGLPLHARPDSVGYRLRKFIGRHRLGVGVAAAALVVLLAFGATLTRQQRETTRALDSASTTASFLESLFAAADPFADVRQDTLRIRDLLDPALVRVRDEFAAQPETRAGLLHVIGETYLRLGLYPEATGPLREAVDLRADAPPAERVASLCAFSTALRETGALEEAERRAREAHRLAGALDDPALLARADREQALALSELRRTDEAEALLRTTLDRLERAADPSLEAMVADTEENLAKVLINQGRVDDAEALYRSALDRYERLYGADDPRRLDPLRHLAFALLMSGRLDEAEAFGAEAVDISRATRPGSGSLASMLAVYGAILRRQGRLAEAEAALREAAALPPRRPDDRAVPLGTLASVLHEKGDLEGAIEEQQASLEVLLVNRTADDPSVAYGTVKLAGFLLEQGAFERAEQLLLSAQPTLDGSGHAERHGAPPVATALVELYDAWGRPEEAARWRERLGSDG